MNGLMQHVVTWLFVICFASTCTLHLVVLYFENHFGVSWSELCDIGGS